MSDQIGGVMALRVDRQGSWWATAELGVAVAGGVAAVVIAVAKLIGADWGWALMAGAVVGVAATVLGQVLGPIRSWRTARAEAARTSDLAARRVEDVLYSSPTRIDQADPYSMGVFSSEEAERYGTGGDPVYVTRAVDDVLRPAVGALAHSGGLVVVRGVPKSGKSRTLWEALVDQVGTRVVYGLQPPVGGDHAAKPVITFVDNVDMTYKIDGAESIIWIDDVHEHFGHGLTDKVLVHDLLGRYPGVIVAMTVHTHRLHPPDRPEGSAPVSEDPRLIDHLRRESGPYELPARWDADELDRARDAYPGLEARIENPSDFATLPRWLAGVNHLRDRYRTNRYNNPRGVAVAKAAIDWRRCGMPAGMTTEQLRDLARIELVELDETERFNDEGNDFRAAINWATGQDDIQAGRLRWRGVALLRPIAGTDPVLWRDFDAVTEWAPDIDPPVSDACWEFVLQHLTKTSGGSVGVAAYYADKPAIEETAFRTAAHLGATDAMANLGVLLNQRGGDSDVAEAENWWRRAAELGDAGAMFNLGVLLNQRGGDSDVAEAENWYRRAAELGDAGAMFNLGVLLKQRGGDSDVAEAEDWWRRAAALGDPDAMSNLAVLLEQRGGDTNMTEAERWFEEARRHGVDGPQ